jgi:hypothetical protein
MATLGAITSVDSIISTEVPKQTPNWQLQEGESCLQFATFLLE